MKHKVGLLLSLILISFSSCEEWHSCGGEIDMVNCIYIHNQSTHNVVVKPQYRVALNLNPGQTSGYGECWTDPCIETDAFWGAVGDDSKFTDTVTFIFDDSVVLKHYYYIDSAVSYRACYVPSDKNIFKYSSWYTEDEKAYTYTITEEDYQRALEQSKTLKANLSDNTTAAQIDELLDNYIGLGF